ncbi:outer membrane protein transport protein [Campylobacter sp. RM9344]|uniref:Outer membrane protein transport protein n=1 Tax=Campylobacter californiensis TaxID=1032243 RepID=A0AAW3ZQU7_9BACT|nr:MULTISPECIES: outer membrane protein transport protein [unclassified Campylobacter]MBE2984558.1 outer membrane protein transport protein [Campylobacter sp. RM6883]MBE2995154.1 outer membrane protein transport protein [Campylobacter sp. RM6913]MBE3029075.1 outer membrane protein transport protein [Campylobacter sp. RM9344]MBE3607432.1 outer membrane protein transport protein [Campylobacter sp. RM9337]QCD50032.1 outer membrane transport protein (OMPP1/FadL/TodX family) [Campylobacter sp. RM69
MFKKGALGVVLASTLLYGGAYKIPEQSSDSLGLLASNVAMSFGADAAYFNPANMMFLDPRHNFENTVGWFHTGEVGLNTNDGKSYRSRNFDSLATTFNFVSPEYYENWRFGLALAVPAALGMGWDDPATAFSAHRFKLQVVELNPTVAHRINDQLAVAVGLRAVYSKGRVANDYGALGKRELTGDSIDGGYNAAITYRPIPNLSFAATYRSKVDLTINGDADGKFANPAANYNGYVKVEIPLPAQLVLATAYKHEDLTLLLALERTYWSSFKGYDFNYPDGAYKSNPFFANLMDRPSTRKYRDTNTYRVGVAYDATDKIRLMFGFAHDQDVAKPQETGLELPNTTSRAYSFGINYKISDNCEIALGYVYQDRSSKNVVGVPTGLGTTDSGKIDRADVQIVGTSLKYKF